VSATRVQNRLVALVMRTPRRCSRLSSRIRKDPAVGRGAPGEVLRLANTRIISEATQMPAVGPVDRLGRIGGRHRTRPGMRGSKSFGRSSRADLRDR